MLDVVETLHRTHPHVRFPVACYKTWHYDRCTELLAERPNLPVDLYVGRTSEVIEASDCCLIVSGSVSLELLARKTPAVAMYRGGVLMYTLGHTLVTCEFISLPNLIAGREIMPEFPFVFRRGAHVDRLRGVIDRWIADETALADSREQMTFLADQIVAVGGIRRAAEVLTETRPRRLCAARSAERRTRFHCSLRRRRLS